MTSLYWIFSSSISPVVTSVHVPSCWFDRVYKPASGSRLSVVFLKGGSLHNLLSNRCKLFSRVRSKGNWLIVSRGKRVCTRFPYTPAVSVRVRFSVHFLACVQKTYHHASETARFVMMTYVPKRSRFSHIFYVLMSELCNVQSIGTVFARLPS